MTRQKHFKQLVRARMAKTGESYATARRQTIRQVPPQESGNSFIHLPGSVPAATALRILAANAPPASSRRDLSEAMIFGIAGGIGAGVFSFLYEKEDFASFYIAGRHLWQDDLQYLKAAAGRLGLTTTAKESSGAKGAETQLREALGGGPVIAWVDMAHLPHRAMPAMWGGGGYHLVVIYRIDESAASATIGDLADQPVEVPLKTLAQARGRIKKDKHRILTVSSGQRFDLKTAVRDGLKACHQGLTGGKQTNFTLKAFGNWADRMYGSSAKDSWERVFPPGHRLWQGLTSIYDFMENYGTGGGLMRPLFAEFLSEAGAALTNPGLSSLSERYAGLGRAWSELAAAALPEDVPAFRTVRDLMATKAELLMSGAPPEEIGELWDRLGAMAKEMKGSFPLTAGEAEQLRRGLKDRITHIYEEEVAAHQELGAVTAKM